MTDTKDSRQQGAIEPRPGDTRQEIRTHSEGDVTILDVDGTLSDVIDDLDRQIQLALAESPRGVVCDLTAVRDDVEPHALQVLARTGRHARDWPGVPLAVAVPDSQVCAALRAHPLGRHLVATTSLLSAVSAIQGTPAPAVEWLQLKFPITPPTTPERANTPLAPEDRVSRPSPANDQANGLAQAEDQANGPRAARAFVIRALLHWRVGRVIPSACLVASELVANAQARSGGDVDLSVALTPGTLRLTARDHGAGRARQRGTGPTTWEEELPIFALVPRAFGALPTADGGRVVWAVLDAPEPLPPISRNLSHHASPTSKVPTFIDARGVAAKPFCGGGADASHLVAVEPEGERT